MNVVNKKGAGLLSNEKIIGARLEMSYLLHGSEPERDTDPGA